MLGRFVATRSFMTATVQRCCTSSSQRRNLSFSKLLYPHAKEPPTVTSTQASDDNKATTQANNGKKFQSPDPRDPFDDGGTLTTDQREEIRRQQYAALNTNLKGSSPITPNVPAYIPPNVPAKELKEPETILTTLPNGLRVVTQETYGQISTIGTISAVGSRFEQPEETGAAHFLELLAFGSTQQYSGLEIAERLQDWGGTKFVQTGREQSIHCIDILRPNVEKAMDLLRQVTLEAQILPEEVEFARESLAFMSTNMPAESLLGEALQLAAYGPDQQLGKPHICTLDAFHAVPSDGLPQLRADTIANFWKRQMIDNPHNIVVAGAGVKHDDLVRLTETHFGHLKQGTPSPLIQSVYRGGEVRIPHQSEDGFVRLVVGMHVGGWHDNDLVAACVAQTLLGGGSSFSAGGPGKGMYSRLYRKVLNRYSWSESAEAYTAFHEETGLWGIMGSTTPNKTRELTQVLCENLALLAKEPVSDEELSRARNMLKNNVLTQLESRLVVFEDMGRQILTYGKRENIHETCRKIESVRKDDILRVAQRAMASPPSLASVGADLSQVPHHEELMRWFS